ncbi:Sec-independent protein translocase protein TatB [Pleomorphomonas sp. JP5]|uniref:Sec-independent protein translocase protein TatB n=1 Tax=Pleomorphomonas sp. JP5 TaxID=2942998 RepID=UPI0020436D37|nr:Sec-independent protein translocase protein TatB [Pleomorphomonas sp. JP5]MCM5556162.1 Sec-independent protein translocase protein TatB [Pleomorphomonas sp. JP5]
MFEVGWTEILMIAIVALIVFPTKDLPRLLRTVGQVVGKARRMAGDMQAQFGQALREAEREADLSDIKSSIQNANPLTDLKKTFDPVRTLGDDLKKSMTAPIPPKSDESSASPSLVDTPPKATAEEGVDASVPTESLPPTEASQTANAEQPVGERASGTAASDEKSGSVA